MRTEARDATGGRDLKGKVAIVTGGYSGLGLETTSALAGAGAIVVVPARTPEKAQRRSPASPMSSKPRSISPIRQHRRLRRRFSLAHQAARHPHQQRRHHGVAPDARRARLRSTIRHQPSRPLPAHRAALAGAEGRQRRARGFAQLDRPPHQPARSRRSELRAHRVQQMDSVRPRQVRQCALRHRPRQARRTRTMSAPSPSIRAAS